MGPRDKLKEKLTRKEEIGINPMYLPSLVVLILKCVELLPL